MGQTLDGRCRPMSANDAEIVGVEATREMGQYVVAGGFASFDNGYSGFAPQGGHASDPLVLTSSAASSSSRRFREAAAYIIEHHSKETGTIMDPASNYRVTDYGDLSQPLPERSHRSGQGSNELSPQWASSPARLAAPRPQSKERALPAPSPAWTATPGRVSPRSKATSPDPLVASHAHQTNRATSASQAPHHSRNLAHGDRLPDHIECWSDSGMSKERVAMGHVNISRVDDAVLATPSAQHERVRYQIVQDSQRDALTNARALMQLSPETPRGRPNKVDPLDSVLFGAAFSQPMRLSSPTRAPQRAASPSRPVPRESSQEPQREPTSSLPRSALPQYGGSLREPNAQRAAVPPHSPEVRQSKSPGRRASFNGTVEFAPAYQPPAGWNVRWSPGAARVCTLSEDALTVTGQFPTRVYSDESLPAFRSAMVNICLTKVPQCGVCSIGIARKNCRNPVKKLDSNLGRGDDSVGLMLYTAHTCDIETAGQVVQDNVHQRISAGTVISLNWNGSAGTLAFAIHGHTLGQSIRVRQGSDYVYAVGLKEGAEFVIVNSRLL